MKKIFIVAAVLALLLTLGGCGLSEEPEKAPAGEPSGDPTGELSGDPTGEPDTTTPADKLEAIPFEDGQLYAAAYLGYQEIENLDYYAGQYLNSDRLATYYVSDGDYYLIIPRYAGMTMTLSVNDLETSLPTVLCVDPECGPFIVQCNVSDVFADVTVRLEYEGDAAEFSPFISLENGEIMVGERGLDLTRSAAAQPGEPA